MIKKEFLMKLPSLDDYHSRKEWEDACWQKMIESEDLMNLLITPYERRNFVMRAAILKELESGSGLRQTSRKLFVSLQTIDAVKKSMKENGYKSYLQRSKTGRKKKKYSNMNKSSGGKRPNGKARRTKFGTIHVA